MRAQTPTSTRSDVDEKQPQPPLSAEHRLLGVLRDAHGEPVTPRALAQAGIDDPAHAIFALEGAGYRIDRAYSDTPGGKRRLLGYRLVAVRAALR